MNSSSPPVTDVKKAGTKGGDGPPPKEEETKVHLSKTEYDALVTERDQLKINLYLLGNNLKENGFTITEQGTALQRLGNDIVTRIRLTPEQLALIQRQVQQQQQQQQ